MRANEFYMLCQSLTSTLLQTAQLQRLNNESFHQSYAQHFRASASIQKFSVLLCFQNTNSLMCSQSWFLPLLDVRIEQSVIQILIEVVFINILHFSGIELLSSLNWLKGKLALDMTGHHLKNTYISIIKKYAAYGTLVI